MGITIKFVGALRHISGKHSRTLEYEKCTIRELICEVARQMPELKRKMISEQAEDLRSNALILVNGREIGVLDGLETVVESGDEVVLVPIVHGG